MTTHRAITGLQGAAPWWTGGRFAGGAVGGNWQTIVSARLARAGQGAPIGWQRQRWETPDGDFIDVDFAEPPGAATGATARLVVFHGLEGSSEGHYAKALASAALARGWPVAVPHFRGCSGELNRAPRAYHSGDFEEIGWMLGRLREHPWGGRDRTPLLAVGISLGGNALLRWAQEAGAAGRREVAALAAVSAPVDLMASGAAIDQGFNRRVYARMFLRTMIPKALAKWQQHPGLFDRGAVARARTIRAFDDAFTAPIHGFRGVDDYWTRASAKPGLGHIRLPALVLNARNDPFVPGASLPQAVPGSWVHLVQPAWGGHLGFASGRAFPGSMDAWAGGVLDWLGGALDVDRAGVWPSGVAGLDGHPGWVRRPTAAGAGHG